MYDLLVGYISVKAGCLFWEMVLDRLSEPLSWAAASDRLLTLFTYVHFLPSPLYIYTHTHTHLPSLLFLSPNQQL